MIFKINSDVQQETERGGRERERDGEREGEGWREGWRERGERGDRTLLGIHLLVAKFHLANIHQDQSPIVKNI